MPLYSSLPLSLGYSSHLPRHHDRPASFYLDDGSSSAFVPEELGYSPFSHTFPPRIDAETRYRRALYELQDAEQEFEAHVALERARQVAILRQRAAAKAARRERALAVQAEIESIEHARALQVQLEEYERRQSVLQAEAALDRAPYRQHPFLHGVVDANINGCSVPGRCSVERGRSHCRRTPAPARRDTEALSIGDIFKLFSGIEPEFQPAGPPTPPTPSQQPPAEPQPPSKPNDAEVAFNDVLEFFHDVATRAIGAASEHKPTHEVRLST
ncbi:hypothetical protein BJV78DRAFT_684900 [Lactifluus subvellereus]|nr:hypothetical protein BJV78DRAFT_684900 [Lactifluus subvellereus]